MMTPSGDSTSWFERRRIIPFVALALILLAGAFLRAYPLSPVRAPGPDSCIYGEYVNALLHKGLGGFSWLFDAYVAKQAKVDAFLPPTRLSYLVAGYLWHQCFGTDVLVSLHAVSIVFSILLLLLTAVSAARMLGTPAMLGIAALMAVAPTQIHAAQHAFIDGFFAFWALLTVWALWENLRAPDHPGWLALYGISGAILVMTKENAAFVYMAIAGLLAANHFLKFGRVTLKLLLLTVAGPLVGVAVLVGIAGGFQPLIALYTLLVAKNHDFAFNIQSLDGPWFRYLLDLMLVSPVVMILAFGGALRLRREDHALLYLTLFVVFSYLIMCNIKYSMNLRYANMWDMPLRFLAFSQLAVLCARFGQRKTIVLALAVSVVCLLELWQGYLSFVRYPMYELTTDYLMQSVRILKP